MTPFIEFLESLLTGTGRDLELQTFKLTDQVSGRQLGVRADITRRRRASMRTGCVTRRPTRLCYIGGVFARVPTACPARAARCRSVPSCTDTRVPSDVEIVCLMMETLRLAGLDDVYLDLGHVGIYRALAMPPASATAGGEVVRGLQRKATAEIGDAARRLRAGWRHARHVGTGN